MPVVNQDTTFLYLQPVRASITTLDPSEISSQHRQLQLIKSQSQSLGGTRVQLKVRDIMKINKQYKVYGSELHFYNAVFEVSLKNSDLSFLKRQTLTLQLKSLNKVNNFQTRRYHTSLDSLLKLAQDKQNLVNQIAIQCQDNVSKLVCNFITSESPLSLQSLEQMFENIQSFEMRRNSSKISVSEFLQTNASTVNQPNSSIKFQRTTKTCKNVQGKLVRRSKKKILGVQMQLISSKSIQSKESPAEGRSNREINTSFYYQSPRIKRISRLRRSVLIPHELQPEVDEEEHKQALAQYKNFLRGSLHNIFLLMGVIMIYAMMIPSRKI